MRGLLVYGLIAAAVVVLVWPGSRGGQAIESVTGSLSSALRGG